MSNHIVSSCIYYSYIVLQNTCVIVDIHEEHEEDGVIDQLVCFCLHLDYLSREDVLLKSNLLVVPLTDEDAIEKKERHYIIISVNIISFQRFIQYFWSGMREEKSTIKITVHRAIQHSNKSGVLYSIASVSFLCFKFCGCF